MFTRSISNSAAEPLPRTSAKRKDVAELLHWAGDGLCQICFTPIDLALTPHHPAAMQIDHLIPTSQGGADTVGNIRLTHARCNNEKNGGWIPEYPSPELARERLALSIFRWNNPCSFYRATSTASTTPCWTLKITSR